MPDFEIFINGKNYSTSQHQLTGRQIKEIGGVADNYELFVETGKESKPVGPDEVVHIHEKQRFRAIPPGTFGEQVVTSEA